MIRLLVTFMLFAGIVYYFNVDIIALVEKSGVPNWFQEQEKIILIEPDATSTPEN